MAEEKLIEAVRQHRELYDTKHPNYMKTKLKNRIWGSIAKDLNFRRGEEAKITWLKLRGSYRDARRRQLRYLQSGVALENIKSWRFQNQMSFLESFMSAGQREENANDDSNHDPQWLFSSRIEDFLEIGKVEVSDSQNEDREQYGVDINENNGEESSMEFAVPHTDSFTPHLRPKYRKQDNIRNMLKRSTSQRVGRARQRAEERRRLESNTITNDPLYNFFVSMYQLTKNMPPNYQHRVRGQLFQVVSQAEEEIMNSSRPASPLSYSSSNAASSSTALCSTYSPDLSPHTLHDSKAENVSPVISTTTLLQFQ